MVLISYVVCLLGFSCLLLTDDCLLIRDLLSNTLIVQKATRSIVAVREERDGAAGSDPTVYGRGSQYLSFCSLNFS